MRALQITLFILGLVVMGTQTLRHVYVKWIEPTDSVLDDYREPVEADIAQTKGLDELVKLFDEADKKVREFEKTATPQQVHDYGRFETEPYKSHEKLKSAIQRWEAQSKSIFELWFYWLCGLAGVAFGLLAYVRVNRWLGMVGIIAGFMEMAFWTSPLWRSWGPQAQFERLLTMKLVLSLVSAALLVGLWLWRARRARQETTAAS